MSNEILSSLGEVVQNSIAAQKTGDHLKAIEYLKSFEEIKNKAILYAENAAKDGDIGTVDKIISSLNSIQETFNKEKISNNFINQKESVHDLLNFYKNKNFNEAIFLGEKLVLINPRNSSIWNILALSYHYNGQGEESVKTFQKGLKFYPDNFDLNNNMSVILKENKKFTDALAYCIKTLEIDPNKEEVQTNIATIYFELKQYQNAIDHYKKSISINPQNPTTIINFANCNLKIGNIELAHKGAELALKYDPLNSHYLNLMGLILKTMGLAEKSEENFTKALEIEPDSVEILNNLGILYHTEVRFDDAINIFKKAINLDPNYELLYTNIANSFISLGKNKEALYYIDKCLNINPNFFHAYAFKGSIEAHKGNKKGAIKFLLKAIKLNELNVEAHRQLSRLKTYKIGDPHLMEMEMLSNNSLINEEEKATLNFALGKAYEDIKDYQKSFNCFNKGNHYFEKLFRVEIKGEELFFNELIKKSQKVISNKISPIKNKRPIFVLGLPRSGTSLVEQILSSHSSVEGHGELNNLSNYIEENLIEYKTGFVPKIKDFGEKEKEKLMNYYLSSVELKNPSNLFFVDKMPHNFRWVSYILSSMPFAKIILMERDPIDNCYSIFKMIFSSRKQHAYSYNLEKLGKYYLTYSNMINHWKNNYGNYIYSCSYEDLVLNPEIEIRKITDFCDLEWEDNVLSFYKTKRNVNTASHSQVREKLYTRSIGIWKNFETELLPLTKILTS